MEEKKLPWWRRALSVALDGLRSGFGLFSRSHKEETNDAPESDSRRQEELEEDIDLTEHSPVLKQVDEAKAAESAAETEIAAKPVPAAAEHLPVTAELVKEPEVEEAAVETPIPERAIEPLVVEEEPAAVEEAPGVVEEESPILEETPAPVEVDAAEQIAAEEKVSEEVDATVDEVVAESGDDVATEPTVVVEEAPSTVEQPPAAAEEVSIPEQVPGEEAVPEPAAEQEELGPVGTDEAVENPAEPEIAHEAESPADDADASPVMVNEQVTSEIGKVEEPVTGAAPAEGAAQPETEVETVMEPEGFEELVEGAAPVADDEPAETAEMIAELEAVPDASAEAVVEVPVEGAEAEAETEASESAAEPEPEAEPVMEVPGEPGGGDQESEGPTAVSDPVPELSAAPVELNESAAEKPLEPEDATVDTSESMELNETNPETNPELAPEPVQNLAPEPIQEPLPQAVEESPTELSATDEVAPEVVPEIASEAEEETAIEAAADDDAPVPSEAVDVEAVAEPVAGQHEESVEPETQESERPSADEAETEQSAEQGTEAVGELVGEPAGEPVAAATEETTASLDAQPEAEQTPAPAPAPETPHKPFIKLESRDNEADLSPFSVIVSEVYDGPLDLLLDLIRKQDIDIYDIPIARITAQFLAYVNQLKGSDVDVAGEFIYMASLLIHIKSKMLLPRAPAGPEDAAEDPRRELVERLLEHERFKNAAQMLQQKQMLEAATWTNPGLREFKDDEGAEPEIAADTVDLVRVFRDILERARNRPVINLQEDSVTVGQMIQFLSRRLLMEDKPIALHRLLSHTQSERALIAMFLALLELVRLQAILLRQDRAFSEIFIKKNTEFESVMNDGLANAKDDWQ